MMKSMRDAMMKKENGAATVVGFVLILAILSAAVVLFFAVQAPAAESYTAESAVLSAKDDMVSFTLLLDSLQKRPEMNVSYLPVFESDGTASLLPAGSISIGGHTIPLSKLSFAVSDSQISLCAGGLIRSDRGDSVWLSFPKAIAENRSAVFVIPQYQGEFSRGASAAGISLSALYRGEIRRTYTVPADTDDTAEDTVYLSYAGEDTLLWQAAFSELSFRYPLCFSQPQISGNTVYSEVLPDGIRSIEIISPEYVIT